MKTQSGSDDAALPSETPAMHVQGSTNLGTYSMPTPMHAMASMQVATMNAWMDAAAATQRNWGELFEQTTKFMRMNPAFAVWQDLTHQQFDDWISQLSPNHQREQGSSSGGRFYGFTKNILQQTLESTPQPYRGILEYQLMHNKALQESMRSEPMADFLEKIGNAMPGNGRLYDEAYNGKFLTEDSHGKTVEIKADDVVKLFPKGAVEDAATHEIFPHIILTSSHAQGETLKDVTGITHGIEAMARDSEKAKLPVGFSDTGVKPGQSLILYACDTHRNPFLNAAALLRRVLELQKVEQTGALETDFKHISPGAQRLARLMLKCMAEDPGQVNTDDTRPIAQAHEGQKAPIKLRDDALAIAHHFQLIGYSKGGNVVSDAVRYLIGELTAKDAIGQPLYSMGEGADAGMSQKTVHGLVRSIAVMAIASIEVGLTPELKANGMRRVAFNNNHDAISAHHNYEGSTYDERWLIEGAHAHLGHAPQDMMGARDEVVGYAHADPRVARRLKEFFAPNYGKTAIGHVHFNETAAQGRVIIEAATGTTDAQISPNPPQKGSNHDTIVRAMEVVGLRGATLTNDVDNPGIFVLEAPGHDFVHDKKSLGLLKQAFHHLRINAPGLVITQTIIDEEIQGQIDRLPQATVDAHSAQKAGELTAVGIAATR